MGGGERFAPWMTYRAGGFCCGGPHMGIVIALKTAAGGVPERCVHRPDVMGVAVAMAFVALKRSLDLVLRQADREQQYPEHNRNRSISHAVHKHLYADERQKTANHFYI